MHKNAATGYTQHHVQSMLSLTWCESSRSVHNFLHYHELTNREKWPVRSRYPQ